VTPLEAMRADAAAVLRDGRARMVLAYREQGGRRLPALVEDPARADGILWDQECRQNLAAWLGKPQIRGRFPVAVAAGPAVMRSLVVLHAESQIGEADVLVLAVGPDQYHGAMDIRATAALLQAEYPAPALAPELAAQLEALRAMGPEERADFWRREFARCTRCYACRAACPGCYCTSCIVQRNQPQWIAAAPTAHGNFSWNLIRAFHQAGRCTQCGACEAACPQGLPLMLLNASLAQEVEATFGHRAGYDPDARPFIGSWETGDAEAFIR
jgi:ferredoxin